MNKYKVALLAASMLVAQGALAQEYPSSAVRIVVPIAAGGGLDTVTRAVAQRLSERWKQPVIIDNRPGAGGGVGAQAVQNAKPDGYTLLAAQDQVMVANRYLYKSLPYDPDKGFAPVAMMVQANQMFLATPEVPAQDLKELVALAKQQKGKFSYGSYGSGSTPQLAYELLNKREGLDILHVPYKGVAPVMAAMMGNEIPLSLGSYAVAGKLIEAGKLKPLAIGSPERDPSMPNVKTTTELGMPWLQVSIWHSLFAPAGTPQAVVDKIAADVRAILKEPDFARQVAGFQILDGGPKELAARNREETARAKEMVESANIKPE
ncbi:Bug family tripartite tricarboxylate transporter substrate binding protein [Hydrogenophaga sp.]|uniref:Bug family tripartite tricarboxylate transporter substrate binding protein n=1 Tax=Hydrogenophaga sp. TaxID=1904254 RepID=UPI003F71C6C6